MTTPNPPRRAAALFNNGAAGRPLETSGSAHRFLCDSGHGHFEPLLVITLYAIYIGLFSSLAASLRHSQEVESLVAPLPVFPVVMFSPLLGCFIIPYAIRFIRRPVGPKPHHWLTKGTQALALLIGTVFVIGLIGLVWRLSSSLLHAIR
jgi:hypothetical protein